MRDQSFALGRLRQQAGKQLDFSLENGSLAVGTHERHLFLGVDIFKMLNDLLWSVTN